MAKTIDDLLKRFAGLRSQYSERDMRYEANWYAYKGEYERLFSSYSADALTISHSRREKYIQKWNLIRPIVDNYKLLINQLPTIEVPAPVLGDELAALKADKQEKVLYALWDMGNMKRKHGEAAFNLALQCASVWQVVWDEDEDIPVTYVRSPGETYPVFRRGGEEVAFCFFRWEEETDSLVEKYPDIKPLLTRNRVGTYTNSRIEVIEYVDDEERLFIVGGGSKSLLPEGGKHKLKKCPVYVTSGMYVPGEPFPPGPIDQLVAMNDYLNRFQTKLGDAIEETLFGWHDVTGEGAKDVVLDTGPGAVNYLEGDIKHDYVQPQAPPAQAFGHVDLVQRYMRNMANWPESASGEMEGSIVTGKAVSQLQGIMSAQATEYQSNLGSDLQKVNSMLLRMLETYRADKKYQLYASEAVTLSSAPGRQHNFVVECIPSEDINGYYRNTLHYSPFGTDMNSSIQIGMQLVDARIRPRSWLSNLLPGNSDAEGYQAEIEEEDRRRMQLEVDLQVQAQERILAAQTQQQMQLQQQQMQAQGSGGTSAQGQVAPASETAPLQQGGLPPQSSSGGEMIGGNAMLMPGGQPQLMGLGEPMTGEAEDFPIPYTPLSPYGPALSELAGTGVHGAAANEGATGLQAEAMPGMSVVKSEDVKTALEQAVNRKGEPAVSKLQGQVYLMGEIAQRGWTDGKIEIGITVKSDQQILTTALAQYAAQKLLAFRVISAGVEPEDGVLLFGPSTKTPAPVR
jgi:hypothetical protein